MPGVQKPLIISNKLEMTKWSRSMRTQGKSIGFVPTMGFLHDGHLSLIKEAHKHAQTVVVSIYVNPGQFSASEDFCRYPSDFDGDLKKLMSVPGGVDAVFIPRDLYDYCAKNERQNKGSKVKGLVVSSLEERGAVHETWVKVENLDKGLCGRIRPVLFRGIATVVCKLFNIVEPDVAIFGKKDYQQWRVICQMVRDLDFPIQVIGLDTMREDDGLAMSSRNVYLSLEERQQALSIYRSLSKAKHAIEGGETNCKELQDSVILAVEAAGGKVDYAEIVDQQTLQPVEEVKKAVVFCVAAWFGKARLIDNMEINV